MDGFRSKLKKEAREIRRNVRERTLTFISAGFGLVVGLAWNDAISGLIKYLFPNEGNGIFAKFIYAIILTVFVTLIVIYLERAMKDDEIKEERTEK